MQRTTKNNNETDSSSITIEDFAELIRNIMQQYGGGYIGDINVLADALQERNSFEITNFIEENGGLLQLLQKYPTIFKLMQIHNVSLTESRYNALLQPLNTRQSISFFSEITKELEFFFHNHIAPTFDPNKLDINSIVRLIERILKDWGNMPTMVGKIAHAVGFQTENHTIVPFILEQHGNMVNFFNNYPKIFVVTPSYVVSVVAPSNNIELQSPRPGLKN